MKQFKEFLCEAYANTSKHFNKASEELVEINADRIGKPVITPKGIEVKNSLVVGHGMFAIKKSGEYKISFYNQIQGQVTELSLTSEEFNLIKKLR